MGYKIKTLEVDKPYNVCEIIFDDQEMIFQTQSADVDPQIITDDIENNFEQLEKVRFFELGFLSRSRTLFKALWLFIII